MADIIIPDLGESILEGTLHRWHVKEGDAVKYGDVLAELETDKVNLEISAEADGVMESIIRQAGEVVGVGEVIGTIGAAGVVPVSSPAAALEAAATAAPAPAPAAEPAKAAAEAPQSNGEAVHATPAARKLAREQGVALDDIRPRDPIGRVHAGDVRTGAGAASGAERPAERAVERAAVQPASASQSVALAPHEERVRMSRRRQTIAKRLVQAQQTAAMLTTFNEVDMTAIMDVRKRRKNSFKEKNDVGLGFMSFFTKAVVGALKKYPLLNAEIDGEDIIVKKHYDIGIAVSAKEGLVVPVVRDADKLGFAGIEKEILHLAEKARSNTLSLNELQGGTFTITNGGVFGSLLSTPILNTPQVGILGMHTIQLRPVAIDEERMENRPMMYIALSYDHRIVDGSEAVSFLRTVKELLEDPEELLLQG